MSAQKQPGKSAQDIKGVWTALITPFTADNQVDLRAFKRILKDQVDAGVTGVIPCGTTGEAPTLSTDERKQLIETAVEETKDSSVGVFAGTGTNDTQASVELSRWASQAGVDGILLTTPYYNKPTQEGLQKHFLKIADAVSCEVMPYNVPSRTGIHLSVETVVALSRHERINSLKEASGDLSYVSSLVDELRLNGTKLNLLSGDDPTFLPFLAVGGVGVVSVASNLLPRGMVALFRAMEQGEPKKAQIIHQKYFPIFRDLFIEPNPVPIKYALSHAGLGSVHVREPLCALGEANITRLEATLRRGEFSAGGGTQ